jgi:hypothetical protein
MVYAHIRHQLHAPHSKKQELGGTPACGGERRGSGSQKSTPRSSSVRFVKASGEPVVRNREELVAGGR